MVTRSPRSKTLLGIPKSFAKNGKSKKRNDGRKTTKIQVKRVEIGFFKCKKVIYPTAEDDTICVFYESAFSEDKKLVRCLERDMCAHSECFDGDAESYYMLVIFVDNLHFKQ